MMDPPATRAEIAAVLDDSVDDAAETVDRIHATGASLDEIGEAYDDTVETPTSDRVIAVRAILRELAADGDRDADSGPMSMLGEPIERL